MEPLMPNQQFLDGEFVGSGRPSPAARGHGLSSPPGVVPSTAGEAGGKGFPCDTVADEAIGQKRRSQAGKVRGRPVVLGVPWALPSYAREAQI